MVNDVELIIDWFQVTVFPNKDFLEKYQLLYLHEFIESDRIVPILFKYLFDIDSINIIRESLKLNGYDVVYSYRDIKVMFNSTREDMGINILLSGQACRQYEEINSWQELFNKILEFDVNFNRIDIALDTFTDRYYTIDKLKRYIKNGDCSSKFKAVFKVERINIENCEVLGEQLQFGSKASLIEITFYNKLLERQNAGRIIEENIKHWYRCELRFRHEHAEDLFKMLYNDEDYSSYVKSILYNYIDFKVPCSKDSNRSRRPTVRWWQEFVDNNNKLKLARKSSETSITKKYNWLLSSISKTEMMVYFSKLDNFKLDVITTDLMYNMITRGLEKIDDKDLNMINNHRISNKLNPITKGEILDYIQNLKDYLY